MVKERYRMFWLCCLMIAAIAGCDSTDPTKNIDPNNLRLTIAASPTTVLTGEFSTITATLINVDISVGDGTTTTTTETPVPGYPVTFTITRNESNCAITVVNSLTDASGNATAIYQAGPTAGTDIVQASIDADKTASASVIVTLPAAR
jgi:hypothetical protein